MLPAHHVGCRGGPCSTAARCRPFSAFTRSAATRCRMSTCRAGPASGSAGDARLNLLQTLQTAVESEDYAAAVEIKRQIDAVDDADPLLSLRKRLQQAVAEERYQDAAQLKQQLMDMEARLQPEQPPCCSDTTTDGIRVQVESEYVPHRSMPAVSQYFFTYKVTLKNSSSRTVQLKSRHWVITDGTGRVEHVRGPGVVGQEPVLAPGSAYSYQSACPLHTPQGSMSGEFTMAVLEADSNQAPVLLDVVIGKFGLSMLRR